MGWVEVKEKKCMDGVFVVKIKGWTGGKEGVDGLKDG